MRQMLETHGPEAVHDVPADLLHDPYVQWHLMQGFGGEPKAG